MNSNIGVPSPGGKAAAQAWARIMEALGCAIVRIPLSASLLRSKGMQAKHLAAGAVDNTSKVTPNNYNTIAVNTGTHQEAFHGH